MVVSCISHSFLHVSAALSGLCIIQFRSRSKPVPNHDFLKYPCLAFLIERRPICLFAQAVNERLKLTRVLHLKLTHPICAMSDNIVSLMSWRVAQRSGPT